jgi:hypothetical protein
MKQCRRCLRTRSRYWGWIWKPIVVVGQQHHDRQATKKTYEKRAAKIGNREKPFPNLDTALTVHGIATGAGFLNRTRTPPTLRHITAGLTVPVIYPINVDDLRHSK